MESHPPWSRLKAAQIRGKHLPQHGGHFPIRLQLPQPQGPPSCLLLTLFQVFQTKIGNIPIPSGSNENRAGHDCGPRKKSPYPLRNPRNVGAPEVPVNAKRMWTKKMLFHNRIREYTGLCHAVLVFSARAKVPCMVRTQLNVWGARRMCGHLLENDTENNCFLPPYCITRCGDTDCTETKTKSIYLKAICHFETKEFIHSTTGASRVARIRFTWTTSSSIARYPEILTGYRPPLKHDIYLGLEPITTTLVHQSNARRQGPWNGFRLGSSWFYRHMRYTLTACHWEMVFHLVNANCKKFNVYRRARVGARLLGPADKYSAMVRSAKQKCRYRNSSPAGGEPSRSKKKKEKKFLTLEALKYRIRQSSRGSQIRDATFPKTNTKPRVFGPVGSRK